MATIDQPAAWILRLFEMEAREGRGADCVRFPEGSCPAGIPLDAGERVYGVYKNKYYFTPAALIISDGGMAQRIAWADVRRCSSRHGEGDAFSELTLADGQTVRVRIGDMAKGHSGRISQLYHQMIERHGGRAAMGRPLMPAGAFFEKAKDDYSIAPNLEPHPPLKSFRAAVQELEQSGDARVFVELVPEIEELAAQALVIVSQRPREYFEGLAELFQADGVLAADERVTRLVSPVPTGFKVWHLVWD